jgi:hypothetical protein
MIARTILGTILLPFAAGAIFKVAANPTRLRQDCQMLLHRWSRLLLLNRRNMPSQKAVAIGRVFAFRQRLAGSRAFLTSPEAPVNEVG